MEEKKRIDWKGVSKKQWIKAAIWGVIILLFSIWVGSAWFFLIVYPFIFDIYVTRFIPWRWWEKSSSSVVRGIMGLVEDLIVVLIIVHFLNLFVFQQFKIPSGSLEKTALIGDHLFVSKLSYGPRVPIDRKSVV